MRMKIVDRIYGEFLIDGTLEEIILSNPVQRLKGVYQGGASFLVNETWNGTRFEHSIGVMLLIRKFGGSIEEQIAGLLHDVSHTAFSHVIDFVFENKNEDYHEQIYHQIILNSEIPAILAKYGYNYENILFDHSKWTLLEQAPPELCADRIDYTLRDMYQNGIITLVEINRFLQDLTIIDGKIYIKDLKTAEWFVRTYYKEVIDFFMDPLNIYGNDLMAKTIKIALEKEIITLNSLLQTDEEVMNCMQISNDKEVITLLTKIHRNVIVVEDKVNFDLHRINKARLIDPSVYHEAKLIRSSDLSLEIKKMNENAKRKAEEGMFVRIVSN